MKRYLIGISLALALALIFAIPVLAGGWAVITLDELPGEIVTGQPLEIGFMVRQHGITPMKDLAPQITAHLPNTSKYVEVTAKAEGEIGHYMASLTLPEAGEWQWSIEAFTMNQPMPPLTVVPTTVAATEVPTAPVSGYIFLAIGLLAAVIGILFSRNNKRWAVALVLMGLIISGYGATSATSQPNARNEPQASSSKSQVQLGRELFIAKGCVTCHYHSETYKDREFGVDIGPNLTNFKASPEYLRLWLADPQSVKPAKMPTLGLSQTEIEALIAFINND